ADERVNHRLDRGAVVRVTHVDAALVTADFPFATQLPGPLVALPPEVDRQAAFVAPCVKFVGRHQVPPLPLMPSSLCGAARQVPLYAYSIVRAGAVALRPAGESSRLAAP